MDVSQKSVLVNRVACLGEDRTHTGNASSDILIIILFLIYLTLSDEEEEMIDPACNLLWTVSTSRALKQVVFSCISCFEHKKTVLDGFTSGRA